MSECKPGCRYVGMESHPAECEPRVTVGGLYERGGYLPVSRLLNPCPSVSTGALPHNLGDMPEACLTCAAKRAEESARGQG